MNINNVGGNRYLRVARIMAGLTQRQLADKLDISHRIISSWEIGEKPIDKEKLEPLANVLDCTTGYLEGKEGNIDVENYGVDESVPMEYIELAEVLNQLNSKSLVNLVGIARAILEAQTQNA